MSSSSNAKRPHPNDLMKNVKKHKQASWDSKAPVRATKKQERRTDKDAERGAGFAADQHRPSVNKSTAKNAVGERRQQHQEYKAKPKTWSNEKNVAKQQIRKVEEEEDESFEEEEEKITSAPPLKAKPTAEVEAKKATVAPASSSSLLDKYRKKLEGAKFRMLNESLYTGEKTSTGLSQQEFDVYHQGFSRQVSKWPTNPVNVIMDKYITPTSRRLEIGDFGCGDAKIAQVKGRTHNVHSFDLVAANPSVIACDIGRDGVPLDDDSLDMVIFSLSLMGSDVTSYLREAKRVLRSGGELVIAEVKSRFSDEGERSQEAMTRGLNKFCSSLKAMGFRLLELDSDSNTMFVLIKMEKMRLAAPSKRNKKNSDEEVRIILKACEYKRR